MTTTPTAPTQTPKGHRKPWGLIAGVIASLLVGVGIGSAGDSSSPSATAPAVTVTAQAAPGAVKTIEVPGPTKTINRTPPACLNAIDKANAALGLAAEGFGFASDGFNAMAGLDITAMEESNRELKALAPKLKVELDAYAAARTACRAS